ncbi:M15 family metallopeptidase [Archangium lansingense]|uniref:M15 family metallopeptidase n=1 Tax=Archangium lansingense TaxID=2995310 RepID=A0ABT4A367_9BACT|nr:M15 family metallopeptidase [Archangium lansinium]MCY1075724.1 M15 family metallopeptidase [Archangium lansinium]
MSYPHQEPTHVFNTKEEVKAAYGDPVIKKDPFDPDSNGSRFEKTSRVFGNPILESFYKSEIVAVELPGIGPQKSATMKVWINRRLAHLLLAAFEKIKAENLPYVIYEVGGYNFRYKQNPSVRTAIENRPEYAELRTQKDFADYWNSRTAEHDRAHGSFLEIIPYSGGTSAKKDLLSNHSWGSAIDINWGTNPFKAGSRFDMPRRIVEIMANLGFHWGGYYHDYMHFEYLRDTIEGLPDEEPPQVFFPFSAAQKRESPLKYYVLNERGKGGYFPLGLQQNLHGGVHLEPEASEAKVPVQAAMPGYIVAARLMAPGTGGDNPDVRYVTEGRHLGFVLVRHEFVGKSANGSSGGSAGGPAAGSGEPEKVHPLYSLYMHLAPPAWGPDTQGFEKAPWLAALMKMQFGAVVNLDPNSPNVGKTFWSQEPLNPEAASIKVHDLKDPLPTRSGERSVALCKSIPEDVEQAIKALQEGAIVTFDRALFPVTAGETIGFVTEGLPFQASAPAPRGVSQPRPPKLPKYLHWELFSPADNEGGIQFLRNKAGDLNNLLKQVQEAKERENNFLEMPSPQNSEAPNEIQEIFGSAGWKVVEKLQKDTYGDEVSKSFNDGKTFFSSEGSTTEPFTYPLDITLKNEHQYKGEAGGSCILEVSYKKAGAQAAFKTESIQIRPDQEKVTLNVPAEADELSLWSPHFFLDTPTPAAGESPLTKRLESRSALFKKAAAHRWRNVVLEHVNEWTPKGLEAQLDARQKAGHVDALVDTSNSEAFTQWKKNLRPLSWWSRRKDEQDPFGEVPVLGAEAEQKSIFGEGDPLLPENAHLVNMHPVTTLWLIDLLLEKQVIALKKSWPPATLKRSDSTQKPLFLGLLWKEQEPRVGMEVNAVLVQHGYATTDGRNGTDVLFWATAQGEASVPPAPLMLRRTPYVEGVAKANIPFPFWGKWEMHATDGAEQRFAPVNTGVTALEVSKPEVAQTFTLGKGGAAPAADGKVRPLSTGSFVCNTNWPVALAGYVVFDYWQAAKKKQPDLTTPATTSELVIPVVASRPSDEKVEGGLKYKGNFIVGKQKENPKVTTNYKFNDFAKSGVFMGEAKDFRLSVLLANRLQQLQDLCKPKKRGEKDIKLVVKQVIPSGLSLVVAPASEGDIGTVVDKLPQLPADERYSATRAGSAIRLTYTPPPATGPIGFQFDPGPALGLIAEKALSSEGETLHVRPRFIAPNGGHTLLTGKASPVGDPMKLIEATVEEIKAACGNDFLEVTADKLLPPVARFEFGEITIKMGAGKVHTDVPLYGDVNQWKAAGPIIKLEVMGETIRQGTISGSTLSADWNLFKEKKKALQGRWGGTLNFSVELSQPGKVATPPPPAKPLQVMIKPSLDELAIEVGPKKILFVGKASFMPTDIALHITCEKLDEAGQWHEDMKITELIRYTVPLKDDPSHYGHCKDTGVFEANLIKDKLKKAPGTYRFTWSPKGTQTGNTVDVKGIPVEVKSAPELNTETLVP